MGAMRKKRLPPATVASVSPTAPVSQNTSPCSVASRATSADTTLPWLPITTDT